MPKRLAFLTLDANPAVKRSSATCNLTPEDFTHELIQAKWPSAPQFYDLRALLSSDYGDKSKGSARMGEVEVKQYVTHFVSGDTTLEVMVDKTTDFLEVPDLFASTKSQRADICVRLKNRLPVLCIEVHSDGDYMNTLAKLVGMLLAHLRALRNLDVSITQVCGFAFPKLGVDSALTKITVSWHKMQFHVGFQCEETVEKAREAVKSFFTDGSFVAWTTRLKTLSLVPIHNVIPLSPEEIKHFGASKQIPSNSSIILYCPGNTAEGTKGRYLKYNPSYQDNSTPWEFRDPNDVVVSMTKRRELAPFYESQEHKRIHFEEAKAIKHKFVKATADSLEKLHKESDRAHLDVRLPNICYDEDGVVRFIGFVRSAPAQNHAYSCRYASNMYKAPSDGWTMAQLDWKQFGLLIGQLTQENYDVENPPVCSGPIQGLLDALLKEGRWDEGAYQAWVVSESHGPGPHT